jgi:hypothetical protein
VPSTTCPARASRSPAAAGPTPGCRTTCAARACQLMTCCPPRCGCARRSSGLPRRSRTCAPRTRCARWSRASTGGSRSGAGSPTGRRYTCGWSTRRRRSPGGGRRGVGRRPRRRPPARTRIRRPGARAGGVASGFYDPVSLSAHAGVPGRLAVAVGRCAEGAAVQAARGSRTSAPDATASDPRTTTITAPPGKPPPAGPGSAGRGCPACCSTSRPWPRCRWPARGRGRTRPARARRAG